MADELHLYDFDGTLFRSPERPPWWGPESWAYDSQSLDIPCVPIRPGPEWWISSTVAEAKRSIADPNVYAVLATGRADKKFRWRVPELLKMKGLDFDEVHLSPGGDTAAFKRGLLQALLNRYPNIEVVRMWDDQAEKAKSYSALVEDRGLEAVVHIVKVPRQEALCQDPVKMARRWFRETANKFGW